ncbi:hypothetical protein COV93_08650 [Candidatus Woesearchaeota archaeon CG11_big_fil_rev_8_21_14_0_20_43_8]|nr:MAG: hypothetical protein COV93_08650 [Candidatus Woesearchaeota archaeon CG11_big_fil_rev_8_21_14_0_20_43_8]PIO05374.1 MAG: hypothetical protein COT47_05055 [Candidatus Woesearchaeota archaeon CG08_land_8_20_14_0_20_43_7]
MRDFTKEAKDLDGLLYTDSNEDINWNLDVLDIQKGNTVIGVTGSADLLLLALMDDPAKVIGFDINKAQTYYAELRKKAIELLEYDDYMTLFGYDDDRSKRGRLFAEVTVRSNDKSKEFWDQDNLIDLFLDGAWNKGGATRKDHDNWHLAIDEIKGYLSDEEFRTALGLSGTDEERIEIFDRIKEHDNKYKDPRHKNNYHFRFNITKYPEGIANNPFAVKFADGFVPQDMIVPAISRDAYPVIRSRLDRISFVTHDMFDFFKNHQHGFDRAYLSNIVDYLTISQQRDLTDLMLEKGNDGCRVLYLYHSIIAEQRKDVLDHESWSERGLMRLINLKTLKKEFMEKNEGFARFMKAEFGQFREGTEEPILDIIQEMIDKAEQRGIKGILTDAKDKVVSVDYKQAGKDAYQNTKEGIRSLGRKIKGFDYKGFGNRLKDRLKGAKEKVADKIKETRQLSSDEYVLVENSDKTLAFYSDLKRNVEAMAGQSTCDRYDYVILQKVKRAGPVYDIPKK